MAKKILLALGAIIVVFLVIVALQPSEYRVARTTTISADAADVFPLVNDFHNWDSWSPWAKLDPAMKTAYTGPPAGVGSVYTWAGNSKAGEGRMTIEESQPNQRVSINLNFLKPFPSTSTTVFEIQPNGNTVTVSWVMAGHFNFIGKAASLFMSMDKTVGGDFEKGLSQMKSAAESKSKRA
jgi:hypothetical protein